MGYAYICAMCSVYCLHQSLSEQTSRLNQMLRNDGDKKNIAETPTFIVLEMDISFSALHWLSCWINTSINFNDLDEAFDMFCYIPAGTGGASLP